MTGDEILVTVLESVLPLLWLMGGVGTLWVGDEAGKYGDKYRYWVCWVLGLMFSAAAFITIYRSVL